MVLQGPMGAQVMFDQLCYGGIQQQGIYKRII